ncbi:MAG: radical SAM protein [Candidatus Omnitrophota bacterium]
MFRFAQGVLKSMLFGTPLNVRLWLSSRCNYHCKMCSVDKVIGTPEMSLSELTVVAENLKKIGTSQVILTGGEPLLREDILSIIELFSRYGFIVRIQTNGGEHVSEALLDSCYRAGLNDISISLDTLDPKKQDDICNAENVLSNAQRVIRYCVKNYSRKGVVAVNVVISAKNFFELPDLIEYVQAMGAFFDPCIFVRNFSSLSSENPAEIDNEFSLLRLEKKAAEAVCKKVRKFMDRGYRILTTKRMIDDLQNYLTSGQCGWPCAAGILSFDIAPTGVMAPCCDTIMRAYETPVADCKSRDFMRVFKSVEFKNKCRKIRTNCSGCLFGCYRDPKYLMSDPRVQLEALYKSICFGKILQ